MGTSLTGLKIKDSYSGLLKTTDNGALGASAKQLTDGLGTASPLYLSTTGFGIGATPNTSYKASIYAPFGSGLNGLYVEAGEFNRSIFVANHTNASVSANLMEVQKSGSGVFTIDNSGNVGIGVSPSAKLHSFDSTAAQGLFTGWSSTGANSASGAIRLGNNSTYQGRIDYAADGNTQFSLENTFSLGIMTFKTGGTERMRITSGGFLKASNDGSYVGATSAFHELISNANGEACLRIINSGNSTPYGIDLALSGASPNNTSQYALKYADSTTARLYIWSNGNVQNYNNSYGAISDSKLKENIVDASPKLDDLMQVKIRNYNLIGDDKKQLGVVAQELETIFPAMIDETPDFEEREVELRDENGEIVYETEQVLVSEEVAEVTEEVLHEATAEELDEDGNVIVEAQEAWTETVIVTPFQAAVYETVTTDRPVMTTERVDLGTTTKSVKYSVFVPMLIKAIQELKAEVDVLKGA